MANFSIVLFAALALTSVYAAPHQEPDIKEKLNAITNDLSNNLNKHFPDSKEVTNFLTVQTREFAKSLEEIVKKMQTEIDNQKGPIDEALHNAAQKMHERAVAIQKIQSPEAVQKTEQLQKEVSHNFETLANEFNHYFTNAEQNFDHASNVMNTFAKGVVDDFVKAAETFNNQVQTGINKKH